MFGSSYPKLFVGELISYLCCSCLFAYSSFQHSVLLYIFTFLVPCRNHNPVLSLFMIYHWVCNKIYTTDVTCGAGTAYPSGAPAFTPSFSYSIFCCFINFFVDRCLSFCVFSFGNCVVFPCSIYGVWLPLKYLQLLVCVYRSPMTYVNMKVLEKPKQWLITSFWRIRWIFIFLYNKYTF